MKHNIIINVTQANCLYAHRHESQESINVTNAEAIKPNNITISTYNIRRLI